MYPGDKPTKRCHGEWWHHEVGSEYLAANPIYVPDISNVLQPQKYDWNGSSTFSSPNQGSSNQSENFTKPDCFGRLPPEIAELIVKRLNSKDIANLRLASRSFRQLPNILFRKLLVEEMPWMWEVQDWLPGETDWHALYLALRSACMNLEGLRNRKRIWLYQEQVIERIKILGFRGRLGNEAINS